MDKRTVLAQYFGYSAFRPGQEPLIDAILSGRDVFGIMPTGGGKSICYQVPGLILPGITLVVSPLISLMRDQVLALKAMGIPAAFINSTLSHPQLQQVYRNLLVGKYKIVYVAPERLDSSGFSELAAKLNISLIAVDEAHCISQWGQDFRPSYLRIVHFIDTLPRRPVVGAFTATATPQVQEDVERIMKLRQPERVVTGFDRPNLFFEVCRPKQKDPALLRLLAEHSGKSGIVYCATRKAVEEVCQMLQDKEYAATRYHAGLREQERNQNQEDFIRDRKPIMVATNAFGMGIDKSNVGFVIHYNMPKSMEAYYQEAGRAGRDGTEADCIVLYSSNDVQTARFLINNTSDNEELDAGQREQIRQQDLRRLEDMVLYCKSSKCLRGYILEYFGQEHPEICGNCGNCKGEFHTLDITRESQMLLSCVKRVYDKLGYWVGVSLICRVLRGSKDRKLLELGLHELSTYGLLPDKGPTRLREIAAKLESDGYLRTDPAHQTLRLTPEAGAVLYHGKQVQLLVPMEQEAIKPVKSQLSQKLSWEEAELYDVLRQVRSRLAEQANVPAYVVFSNATLQDMARKRPQNITEFKRVSGVGTLKAQWYADAFLEAIRNHPES